MKKGILFSIAAISIIIVHSCNKDKVESNSNSNFNYTKSETDNYKIEMNGDYRISRVTHFDSNNRILSDKSYKYSNNEVVVNDSNSGYILSQYFLNNIGLADSSLEGTYRIKYQYNSDKYLLSYSNFPYTYLNTLTYLNGNKTYVSNFPRYGCSYEYTSILNYIDIESFDGLYLGNLNYNLILKKRDQFGPHTRDYTTTNYEYILNSDGLVVKRTAVKIDNSSLQDPKPKERLISNFEYKIAK